MRIAIQGCSHGSLSAIYDTIHQHTLTTSHPTDLLLLCGDFQALRSSHDFPSLAVPPKYHSLGTFHQYYSGAKKAPVLTIVIGGNHEASNYMWELYYGGWLAEGIYYLGAGGCVRVNGVRIAGLSGIYKGGDYYKGHFEKVPYNNSTMRSVYHIRQYDVMKLLQLPPTPHQIFLSHDWPLTIPQHGNLPKLLRHKPFFKDEIRKNTLGSPPLLDILKRLQPDLWFAAHLHVKFAAVFEHSVQSGEEVGFGGSGQERFGTRKGDGEEGVEDGEEEGEGRNELEEMLAAELARDAEADGGGYGDGIDGEGGEGEGGDDVDREEEGLVNPDEIMIDEEDDFEEVIPVINTPKASNGTSIPQSPAPNPEEIHIDEDEFDEPGPSTIRAEGKKMSNAPILAGNPEEIQIDDDEFDEPEAVAHTSASALGMGNAEAGPSKPRRDVVVDESVDVVEAVRAKEGPGAMEGVIGVSQGEAKAVMGGAPSVTKPSGRRTKFLALDKCGAGKDFIQFLEIPTPEPIQEGQPPKLTYDPEWLAITRALDPFLSLNQSQHPLPPQSNLDQLIHDEIQRIKHEGLLVPEEIVDEDGLVRLGWEKGDIEVSRVQKFWPTAPAEGQPGGSAAAWYTNPQTEAFCGMLGIVNRINPAPSAR